MAFCNVCGKYMQEPTTSGTCGCSVICDVVYPEDTLAKVQFEMIPWVAHNFGDRPAWQPLLGIVEEVGELSHAFLKREQGIRTSEPHDENIKDAVADIMIYLCDFCNAEGINLHHVFQETWTEVKKRDWQADREKGEANDGN